MEGKIMECLDCNNQGWILSNNEDFNNEIQKCDNCDVFKSDKEAQNISFFSSMSAVNFEDYLKTNNK